MMRLRSAFACTGSAPRQRRQIVTQFPHPVGAGSTPANPRPRVAFVTGASSGFGAAIARRFVAEGARVIGAARRPDRLHEIADELGPAFLPFELDVRDRSAVEVAVTMLPAEFADVDVLVNNAGLAKGLQPAPTANLDDWDAMIDTNCRGLVYCSRAFLPGMVARGVGHVINLGSIAGTYPYPGGNVYGATKAFVHQFSLNLRSDLHGSAIRVTCIEPGLSGGSEFSEVRFDGDRERAAALYKDVEPLLPADVAEAVYWTASLPAHVNVNTIELMPVAQSSGALLVSRHPA
ncbi:MAG: 3-hydroxy acid dehydrogenase / malonic semialdehyde reductase [Pseudonocardiales bacterium]|nr:3-hydroxy acid dehydrogenase / malonic semialdehyde reductase [Pseudonocardiales bacterium]